MIKTTSILLLLFTALSLHAQSVKNFSSAKPEDAGFSENRLARIDKMLEEHVQNQWIPGAVALIVRDGKIVYYKAFGYSDLDKKTKLKKDDIFRIASQSKAITSLAAMMLWEEGKFLLDERNLFFRRSGFILYSGRLWKISAAFPQPWRI